MKAADVSLIVFVYLIIFVFGFLLVFVSLLVFVFGYVAHLVPV